MTDIKPPKTYGEQIEILRARGIVINNESFCISILREINYYRLTAYMLPFKIADGKYSNVDIERIYNLYEFDRKLWAILLSALEEIEIQMRTKIAYALAHIYGPLGYANRENYKSEAAFLALQDEIKAAITKGMDTLFVQHHIKKYDGNFPGECRANRVNGITSTYFGNNNYTA